MYTKVFPCTGEVGHPFATIRPSQYSDYTEIEHNNVQLKYIHIRSDVGNIRFRRIPSYSEHVVRLKYTPIHGACCFLCIDTLHHP